MGPESLDQIDDHARVEGGTLGVLTERRTRSTDRIARKDLGRTTWFIESILLLAIILYDFEFADRS